VADAINNPDGFKDGTNTGNDYTYDTMGNMLTDQNKGITNIKYNHLNLPTEVVFSNGKINYTYDAIGTRVSKKVEPTSGALITTDYVNGFQYENNELQFFPHAEGYVKRNTNNTYLYVYQYKDHLGNVRLSYADINKNGTIEPASEILEENNYYPFGLKHKGYNEVVNSNRSESAEAYKFGGKELNDELGLDLYDFGARNYDPAIGRWLNVDPLAEKFNSITPYNYVYNNPIFFVDPDGMDIYRFDRKSGELVLEIPTNDDYDQIGRFKYNKKTKGYELKTNRDGEFKFSIENIAKGILKDGINFKQNNNVIEVNGVNSNGSNQPTESQFQNFIVDYTKLAGVEVSGYALGANPNTKDVSAYLVEFHKDNTSKSSISASYNENDKIPRKYLGYPRSYVGKSIYAKQHYHSHPDNSLASDDDKENFKGKSIPHFIFSKKYNQQYNEINVFKATPR